MKIKEEREGTGWGKNKGKVGGKRKYFLKNGRRKGVWEWGFGATVGGLAAPTTIEVLEVFFSFLIDFSFYFFVKILF